MVIKIMIVDDDNDLRFLISQSLKAVDDEYKITQASSGEECLEKIKKSRPDVILMDLMMSGMNGVETAQKIRAKKIYKDIKIIYLSAKTDKKSLEIASRSGVDYIEKPVLTEELDRRIKAALAKK
ncbi:MAG: PleD family two-component system response regulator [Candidatus Woesearchaeota archaeon]